jgi:ribose transport system substrate-binding protein
MIDRVDVPRAARRAIGAGVTVAVAVAVAVAGCGGSGSSSADVAQTGTAADDATTSPTNGSGERVAAAKRKVAALFANASFGRPPATSPSPQRGKNVWSVVAGLAAPGQVLVADAIEAGAKEMGWDLTTFDGRFTPSQYQNGIRQAIADKADGILLYTIDCKLVRTALEEARRARVPVVSGDGYDCSSEKQGAASLYDAEVGYTMGSFAELSEALGRAEADWIIAATDGKAKAIVFRETDLQFAIGVDKGFQDEFETCAECSVVRTVDFVIGDLGIKIQEKAEQALLQSPDANAMMLAYDDLITAGVGAAIRRSGRNDELQVIAGGGFTPNMDIMRANGGQDAAYAFPVEWEGWAAVDTLNRLFAGQPPAPSGIGIGLIDREHNLGSSGPAKAPLDFAAAYRRAWSGQG